MKTQMTITGIDDVRQILETLGPRHARNILRATVYDMAAQIRDEAKQRSPQLTGDMVRATRAKRRREEGSKIRSSVVVTMAAFYWRFREYGQGPDGIADEMFLGAVQKFRATFMAMFLKSFAAKLEAAALRELRRSAKMPKVRR